MQSIVATEILEVVLESSCFCQKALMFSSFEVQRREGGKSHIIGLVMLEFIIHCAIRVFVGLYK